jgi:DNA (cytosine-5)-methyltransferase 1
MTDRTVRIGSLFSGAGGLDMAVEAVFGGEVIWQSEVDKAASRVLAYRFPSAPNLGDITAIDWATVETPDVLCGGFPCQDVSAAGKRAGIKDGTRSGLWAIFADAIDHLRPPIVVIENVRGLLSARAHRHLEPEDPTMGDGADGPVLRAAGAVLGDLADLGYDAQWATLAAGDIGAPHRRERVFIVGCVANSKSDGRYGRAGNQLPISTGDLRRVSGQGTTIVGDGGGLHAADSSSHGWDEGRPESARQQRGSDAAVSGDGHGVDVPLLPTPTASQGRNETSGRQEGSEHHSGTTLHDVVFKGEIGGDALLPTPNADVSRGTRTPEGVAKRLAAGDKQILLEDAAIALLPTPKAHDGQFGSTARTTGRPIEKATHLQTIVSLLPTPKASDGHRGDCPSERRRNDPSLQAITHYLPTPAASDCTGGGAHQDNREGHSRQLIDYALLDNTPAWGKYERAIRRWENVTRPAPAPTEPNKNGNPRLSAAFSEWLMGWPDGWVTDPDIGISRNDQLRIIGNGVCPQQAVAALQRLLNVSTHTHTVGRGDVNLLPTPCSRDWKDGEFPASHARNTPSLGAVSAYFGPDA